MAKLTDRQYGMLLTLVEHEIRATINLNRVGLADPTRAKEYIKDLEEIINVINPEES